MSDIVPPVDEFYIGVYLYVTHSRRAEYELLGWIFAADLGPTHGSYSVLMEWPFYIEPVMPSDFAESEGDHGP